jgi:hypothetical protein
MDAPYRERQRCGGWHVQHRTFLGIVGLDFNRLLKKQRDWCNESDERWSRKFSRKGAKPQRNPLEARQRFASLREKFLSGHNGASYSEAQVVTEFREESALLAEKTGYTPAVKRVQTIEQQIVVTNV